MQAKKQFRKIYDQCVQHVRQIKNNNDMINKSIGTLRESLLHTQIEAGKHRINQICNKVEESIKRLQKGYLDPDTVRKINVLRQQFTLQIERRSKLMANVQQIIRKNTKPLSNNKLTKDSIKDTTNRLKNSCQTNATMQQSGPQVASVYLQAQLQKNLLQQRSEQLKEAEKKLSNIHRVICQTAQMTYAQGQKTDIITDDMYIAQNNVQISCKQLGEAKKNNKSYRRYIIVSFILFLVLGIILMFVFVI